MDEQYKGLVLDDATLEHFGVKGMRWGKRKAALNVKTTKIDRKVINRKRGTALSTGLGALTAGPPGALIGLGYHIATRRQANRIIKNATGLKLSQISRQDRKKARDAIYNYNNVKIRVKA